MKIPANSLLAKSIDSVGYWRAGRVLLVVCCWAYAMHKADEWPEGVSARVDAYRAEWLMSDSTAWRDLRVFRKAFPDEPDPTRIAGVVLAHYAEQLASQEAARALAASGRFATIAV